MSMSRMATDTEQHLRRLLDRAQNEAQQAQHRADLAKDAGDEAAREVDRLRAVNAELAAALGSLLNWSHCICTPEIDDLESELESARAALAKHREG